MPGVGLALLLSCALSMVNLLPSDVSAFAIIVRSSSATVMHSSRKRSSWRASCANVSRRCWRRLNFRSCFSNLLSDTSDMEYFRSGVGGASWATGIVVGVVMLVVVLLGTWSSTESAMMSMFVSNVGVIILLNFFLITVVHPSSLHISSFPYPPHRQLSFFPSFFLCFGQVSSSPVLNSLPSMNFRFIFLHTLLNLNFRTFLFHMHVSGVIRVGC